MHDDESELIAQSLRHDHEAYRLLVDRYKHALYRHCFAIVRDEDVAEDIAQQTFITAYYKLSSFDQSRRFSTWLFKIATNNALNWLKKASKEVSMTDDVLASIPATDNATHEQALHDELHRAVRRLNPKYQAVISLYYWQGLSYQDISHAVGAPLGSVKGWMKRAKTQLRKELA